MGEETILIIDDSKHQRDMVAQYLELTDFGVMFARDGKEGLAVARQHQPDLILVDLQMPGMDGRAVVRQLHADGFDIPVILMTGHGSEAIAVEVFRLGVKDYLMKPFSFEELHESIERSLVEVRLRRQTEDLTEQLINTNANLNRRLQEMRILYSIGKSITAQTDIKGLLQRITGAATMLTDSDEGALYLLEGHNLVCRAIKPRDGNRPSMIRQIIDDPLARRAITTREINIFNPADIARSHWSGPNAPASAMAAPMQIGERQLGAIVIRNYNTGRPNFDRHDGDLLMALADYAAIAFDDAAHYRAHGEIRERDQNDIQRAFQGSRVFVSYRRVDWNDFVEPLVKKMRDEGLDVWVDQHLLETGQDWMDKINEILTNSEYMVLCVSPDALASKYVRFEYRFFIHNDKQIFPVICRETPMPPELVGIQHVPYVEHEALIKRLKKLVSSRAG